jgi:TRAP transporter 4TM/12TM fusion protein
VDRAPKATALPEARETSLLETSLRGRRLSAAGAMALAVSVLAIALALFQIYVAAFGTPDTRAFRTAHLTVMLVLAIALHPLFRRSVLDPVVVPGDAGNGRRVAGWVVDLGLMGIALAVHAYTVHDLGAFQDRIGQPTDADVWMGTLLVLLVLETTRRAVGMAMVAIAAFFAVHTLYSHHFPGILFGPPTRFTRYVDLIFLRTDGIFGIPLLVASTYVVLFIIFGAILLRSGAGRVFMDLAIALTGHRVGGPAKAAVAGSALMGTVAGAATANVATTGAFTIPLMKRLGYRPKFAAAVEACASSGGQIMPPVMGAAAFIIAEFLRVSYFWVIIAAIIPTILYFATIYFLVHLQAEKEGLAPLARDQFPALATVLGRGWPLLVGLGILIGVLAVGYTPMMAAFWGIVAIVGLSFLRPETRMSPVDLLAALENGVRRSMPVTIACACAGIIIGSVFTSGFGLKFTQSIVAASGGSLFALLVLTGVAAIILGMGMTTTAVYITVAALIVPALLQLQVTPMAAHMFAFYYGIVSAITPPVALASFAAAAIAGSPPMATAIESARIGIAKYIVPFIFVYNPSLLFEGPLWLTAFSAVTALAGLWAMSWALEGWFRGRLSPALRLVAFGAALALLYPPQLPLLGVSGFTATLAGAVVVGLFYALRAGAVGWPGRRRTVAP